VMYCHGSLMTDSQRGVTLSAIGWDTLSPHHVNQPDHSLTHSLTHTHTHNNGVVKGGQELETTVQGGTSVSADPLPQKLNIFPREDAKVLVSFFSFHSIPFSCSFFETFFVPTFLLLLLNFLSSYSL
jgi:hypothetical protein